MAKRSHASLEPSHASLIPLRTADRAKPAEVHNEAELIDKEKEEQEEELEQEDEEEEGGAEDMEEEAQQDHDEEAQEEEESSLDLDSIVDEVEDEEEEEDEVRTRRLEPVISMHSGRTSGRKKPRLVDDEAATTELVIPEVEFPNPSGEEPDPAEELSADEADDDDEHSESSQSEEEEDEENGEPHKASPQKRKETTLKDFVIKDKVKKADLNVLTKQRLQRDHQRSEQQSRKAELFNGPKQKELLQQAAKHRERTSQWLENERRLEMHRQMEEERGDKPRTRSGTAPRVIHYRSRTEDILEYVGCLPPAPQFARPHIPAKCIVTNEPARYRTRDGIPFADLAAYRQLANKQRPSADVQHASLMQPKLEHMQEKKLSRVKRIGSQICVVTGAANAKYCHPKSGLPFATKAAYARLDLVFQSGGVRACIQEFGLLEVDGPTGRMLVKDLSAMDDEFVID